ncbi:hypothetical protein SANTM175S_00325 [Streptomyces antimycoticus]
MQTVALGVGLLGLGQPRFGVDVLTEPPGRDGASRHLHRDRADRRPHGEAQVRDRRTGAQDRGGVPRPRLVGVRALGTRIDAERAQTATVRGTDTHLNHRGALLGQHQRRIQGEFLDPVAADLIARPDRQFGEGAAGEHGHVRAGALGQPKGGPVRGDPAGEQMVVRPGQTGTAAPSSGCPAASSPAAATSLAATGLSSQYRCRWNG